jgi:hypothetical protein
MKGRLMLLFISLTVICFCLIISVVFYKQWNGGNQTQHATGDGTIEPKTESVERLTPTQLVAPSPVKNKSLQGAADSTALRSRKPAARSGKPLEFVFESQSLSQEYLADLENIMRPNSGWKKADFLGPHRKGWFMREEEDGTVVHTNLNFTIKYPPTLFEFLKARSSQGQPGVPAPSSEPVEESARPLEPPPPRDGLEEMEGEDSFAPDWDNGDPSAAKQQAFDAMSEGWIRSDADPAAAVERRIADLERESKPKLSPDA